MAAVSYSVAVGGNLETVAAGTNAPAAGTVELRFDQTTSTVNDGGTTRKPLKSEILTAIVTLTEYLMRDTNVIGG